MARILIIFYQPIIDVKDAYGLICFYESFAKELSQNSNEVKCLNTHFLKQYTENEITLLDCEEKEKFIKQIQNFNPDLIFSFNNQITKEIIKITSCPICVFDADGIDFFAGKNFIKKYKDRYFMCSFYKGWEEDKYQKLGFEKHKVMFLHSATSLKNEKLEKISNVSFIGTKFSSISKTTQYKILEDKSIYEDLREYYKDSYASGDKFFKKYKQLFKLKKIDLYPLMDPRLYILQSVWDLGLDIYGLFWDALPAELFNLSLCCHNNEPKYTIKHNQDVYNSSKINISISHPQCKGYNFPWRVYDIMASDGLLISSYSKLLEEYTKGFVKIPMYKSPYEARELCKYALENPSYCKDIIAASNQFIEKYGRWESNLKIIQDNLKINLLNISNLKKGSYMVIKFSNDLNFKTSGNKKRDIKSRYKIFGYSFLLLLAQIPIIDLLINKNNRNKIINKINKYWR